MFLCTQNEMVDCDLIDEDCDTAATVKESHGADTEADTTPWVTLHLSASAFVRSRFVALSHVVLGLLGSAMLQHIGGPGRLSVSTSTSTLLKIIAAQRLD